MEPKLLLQPRPVMALDITNYTFIFWLMVTNVSHEQLQAPKVNACILGLVGLPRSYAAAFKCETGIENQYRMFMKQMIVNHITVRSENDCVLFFYGFVGEFVSTSPHRRGRSRVIGTPRNI